MVVASGWGSEGWGSNPDISDNLWPHIATKFKKIIPGQDSDRLSWLISLDA